MSNKDPFDYLNFGLTENTTMRGTMSSFYNLLMVIGTLGILFTLAFAAIKLSSSNAAQRAEALDDIKWKLVTALILFGMPGIAGVILKFAASFR